MSRVPFLISFLIFLIAVPCSVRAATPESAMVRRHVIRFDPGPAGQMLNGGAVRLTCDSPYTPEVGYGWTQSPHNEFVRSELARSRGSSLLDGVAGSRLMLRADISPGAWRIALWLEVERAGAKQVRVSAQGRPIESGWQEHLASLEPRESPENNYRVLCSSVEVGDQGLAIELASGGDEVRLLDASLIREASPETPEQQRLQADLEAAGHLRSNADLAGLAERARQLLEEDPNDGFAALALERLELLSQAEQLASMRGWQWADEQTGTGMFDRMNQTIMLLDGLLGADGAQAGPLADRALFLRGRLLYWLAKEHGGPVETARAHSDLQGLRKRHPTDELVAMYVGEKIASRGRGDAWAETPGAPAWSTAQHEALCRMREVVHWWVDERQSATGEFGGKFGDDVELLRWWAPLVLSGDATARRGWQRLADGVWNSKHVADGYARKARDVEHAAEFIADTAPMMAVLSDDPSYIDRLEHSARHFENVWTGTTTQGRRFFRSAWFSSSRIVTEEPKGRDVEYNARAVRALRYLAWRRQDPRVIELLHEWSRAWVSAALRTDKGKPRGLLPPSVRFTDEAINGDEPSWHRANMIWDYYDWEGGCGAMLLDQLLFTYTLTHDAELLEPMLLTLALIEAEQPGLSSASSESLRAGSPRWAAFKLSRCRDFWAVVEQWRQASDDARWDDLIRRYGSDFARYQLSGEEQHLTKGLGRLMENMRYNTPLLTTEAIHTDRVYVPGWEHLKAMLTGDGMPENSSPYFAVTWEGAPEGFTALVDQTSGDQLEAQVFSHSSTPGKAVMRPWILSPGRYQIRTTAYGQSVEESSVVLKNRGEPIQVSLPGNQLLRIRISRDNKSP